MRFRKVNWVFLLMPSILFANCIAVGAANERQIVVENVDGSAVPDAEVQVWPEGTLPRFDTDGKARADGANAIMNVRTDQKGIAVLDATGGMITVQHPNYRPTKRQLGENMQQTICLAPVLKGRVINDSGDPVKDVAVTTMLLYLQDGRIAPLNEVRTEADGTFKLDTEHDLGGPENRLIVGAIDKQLSKSAFTNVVASEIRNPISLQLAHTRRINVKAKFPSVRNGRLAWLDRDGQRIIGASYPLDAESHEVAATVLLPPGNYFLQVRSTRLSDEAIIPFEVVAGSDDLDLGTVGGQTSRLAALVGKKAPELALRWRANEDRTLQELHGKIVVLCFWGYWCIPCIESMPDLMKAADSLPADQIEWICIHDPSLMSFEDLDAKLTHFAAKNWNGQQLTLTTVLDASEEGTKGATCKRFGVDRWPTTIVIDQNGDVVGPVEKRDLVPIIEKLLKSP